MQLGFVGTGTISAAIVQGLGRAFGADSHIHLAPRNPTAGAALAEQFGHVRVADSDQAVLDASDIVILALRPQLRSRSWRGCASAGIARSSA